MPSKIVLEKEPAGWVLRRYHLTGSTPSSEFPCISDEELEMIHALTCSALEYRDRHRANGNGNEPDK